MLAADTKQVKSVKHSRQEEHAWGGGTGSKLSVTKKSSVASHSSQGTAISKRMSMSRPRDSKSRKELAAELEFVRNNGMTRVKLRMKVLFAGYAYQVARLDDTATLPTLADCFVGVYLANDLMSEQQLIDLNPLEIKVRNT